jgi:hypothetical protein
LQSNIIRSGEITFVEGLSYALMSAIIIAGLVIALIDESLFRNIYVVEDGFLEYFTALMLFAVAVVCFTQLVRDYQNHTKAFVIINGIIVLLMVFGAGEEVSWGQRIFGIQSNEFFLENNRQSETNLHNMTINGININKLIFSKGLVLFLILFYLLLPSLYKKKSRVQRLFDGFYIPVPKPHHGIAMLIGGLTIDFIASSKRGELNEVCLSIFFLLTVLKPQNKFPSLRVQVK